MKAFVITLQFFLLYYSSISAMQTFDVEQVKKEITDQLSTQIKGTPKSHPLLILVGGYPGAGKTTLIQALAQDYDLAVISWNDVRQALLDKHLRGSPYDWEIIQAVNHSLFSTCLKRSLNIIIDANAHFTNIKLFEDLLNLEHHQDQYKTVKVCLNPPIELLLKRVRAREQREDLHQGTEIDVLKDLSAPHKKMLMEDYAIIIKNDEEIPFETELNIVNAFLKPYFDKQTIISDIRLAP